MKKTIKLPPANAINGRSENPYAEFAILKRDSKDFRRFVQRQFVKQRGRCYYCSVSLSKTKQNIEHIMPRSKHGQNNGANLVIACWKCNKAKGANIVAPKRLKSLEKRMLKRQRRHSIKFKIDQNYQENLGLWLNSWL